LLVSTPFDSEKVTVSVFVLSGSSLKATLTLDGPIANSSIDSGVELFAAGESYVKNPENPDQLSYSTVVDFEHLNSLPEDDDDDEVADKYEEPAIDPDDPDAAEKRRERRERQREKFMEAKQKRDQRKLEQQKKIRQDGDPFVYTTKAPDSGWYKMCVQATWYQVRDYKFMENPESGL
jgi:hypothetical protein